MNKKIVSASLIGSALFAFAAKNTDPVLMTIDGNDVRLSEFEYLYNKNNAQQLQPVTFDEYVNMFVDYKLKVADAHDEGVDTTKEFREEFNKFRNELAAPYLRDMSVVDRLVNEAYGRMGEEVFVSHIMLPPSSPKTADSEFRIDSIRNEILCGNITFEDAARQFSVDRGSAPQGGRMGWVVANGRFPWQFEEAAFNTPVGEISEPVNSGYGWHLVRPEQRRKTRGEVNAQHILILTRDVDPSLLASKKEKIDSIYNVVTAPGADFSEVAKRLSEDPGSARNGGDLGWFGSGRMVAEFDSVSFALADGEISKPFATAYGYHIIKKIAHRDDTVPALDVVRPQLEKMIANDSRSRLPIEATVYKLAKQSNSSLNSGLSLQVSTFLASNGINTADSAAIANLKESGITAYTVNGNPVTLSTVLAQRPVRLGADAATITDMVANSAKSLFEEAMLDLGRAELEVNNSDYRNLLNEYRDGIMLFEVSNRNVWEKASKDEEGLKAYFDNHRDNYKWNSPLYKAYVIFVTSDSIKQEAQNFLANATDSDREAITNALKKKFGKDIKVEKVIAAEGENPITDYLGFNKTKPESQKQKWVDYFDYDAKVISMPEEAADVKGLVITDYQNYLEKEWLSQLHKKHKVKINNKVLKKAKQK